jgi:hypothetical protein
MGNIGQILRGVRFPHVACYSGGVRQVRGLAIGAGKVHMETKLSVRGGITAAAVVMALLAMAATEGPRRPATQAFMRQKLAYSQGILEGLTLEKFDLVSKNAVLMRNMTQSNLWYRTRQVDYMRHTTNFQKSVDALYSGAVDKNLDAATDAYARVSRNCVECHRLVRAEQHK